MSSPNQNPRRRRRLARASALLVAALALLAVLLPATSAAKTARPLYWGAIIGDEFTGTPPPWDMQAAVDFSRSVGKAPSLLQFSAPFSDCTRGPECTFLGFPAVAMQDIRSFGAIPFFNWGSQSIPATADNQAAFRLKRIAHGHLDPFIRNFAEDAAEWGHPFFLRFNWEMNGFWFPWSPGVNRNTSHTFIAAWRHIHDIFEEVGATNATWVWCPNVDFTRRLTPMKDVYPGNRYVDWTCLDGFNWGKTRNSIGWQSFNEVFRSTYRRLVKIAPHKPVMIGETASEERGGSKPKWIEHAFSVIPRKFPKIRGIVWFDERSQGMNWPMESSRASERAFRRGIAPKIYRPNVYAELAPGPIRPPRL